ncbi:pancreatic lipase-related protein 2-like isoform X3 [Aricia agestis]|uniref:pancreatic lipase-related protein 2-like isoform X3 n=1 Tax=Aricia agestis TaxID=91739 RepID=UPI001C207B42|nr:pancreatic lipase-related protein 2-like isoform X3 [Aricia agestis]
MQPLPLACFLSLIRPPGVQFETALLQSYALDKNKCPFVLDGHDIDFLLYTRNNPLVPQTLLVGDDERLFASNMDFNDPTVFLFHGFMETPDDGSPLLIREAYMYRGDTNVITVDSSRLEAGPWYFTAADNTWYIGNFAARLVDYLVSRGLKLSNTHFVGHSLGAQSAGVAGSALTSGRVARITGLDPAWPVFCKLPPPQRLDETDAEFVDVIHADAGIFGFKYAVGHVDFWPNGGRSPQPGCELSHTLPKQLLLNNFFCSHWRSYMFYSESVINPHGFVASACPSWQDYTEGGCARSNKTHMGFAVDRQWKHKTLLQRLPKRPYAR